MELAKERANQLYYLDETNEIRFSHENPSIIQLYQNYLEKPLSHKAHHLLHTNHFAWEMPPTMKGERNLKW